ncbi:MAG: tetratricopeptide repeat protein [Chloroflexi bacterium]|nr:tetratricopeptide repeat protein [Chloroflexota bacterium]
MIWRDPRLRRALLVSLGMTVLIVVVVGLRGPEDSFPLVVGLVGVMAVLQALMLFGPANGSPALQQARSLYRRGRFVDVIDVLEQYLATEESEDAAVKVQTLTLLGNTYRQVGSLAESEARLRSAVELAPEDKQALYGLGRTMLARGEYQRAVRHIEASLENGQRPAVRAELALAMYYAEGQFDSLVKFTRKASHLWNLEDYRTLILNYLLYNLVDDDHEREIAQRVCQNTVRGVAYWESQARRYADTDYGRRLAADVVAIKTLASKEQSSQ